MTNAKNVIEAFSVLAGVLAILFENKGSERYRFSDWMYWATILSIFVVAASYRNIFYTY